MTGLFPKIGICSEQESLRMRPTLNVIWVKTVSTSLLNRISEKLEYSDARDG